MNTRAKSPRLLFVMQRLTGYTALLLLSVIISALICSYILHGLHKKFTQEHPFLDSRLQTQSALFDSVIVLQKSVVDPHKQCFRLSHIDKTWANWAIAQRDMHLLAALPIDQHCSLQPLQRIKTINLTHYHNGETNPYLNLLYTLSAFVNRHPNSQWLLLGNDHTFVVPSNLQRLLNTLDPHQMIYCGNRLGMSGVEGKVLHFASGGGGALLSTVAAKLILLVWIALEKANNKPAALRVNDNVRFDFWQSGAELDTFAASAASLLSIKPNASQAHAHSQVR
jgi:hypothetical protein